MSEIDVILGTGDRVRVTPAGEGGFTVRGLNRPALCTQGETLSECVWMSLDAAAALGGEPDEALDTAVRLHVLAVYERHGRNKTRTAEALGVAEKTLYNLFARWRAAGKVRPVSGTGRQRFDFEAV